MSFVEDVVCGKDAGIGRKIRSGKIEHIKPFGTNHVARLGVFEKEWASAILAESVFGDTCRERAKLLLRVNYLPIRSLETNPSHKRRPMQPLALGAMTMRRPRGRHRHLESHLPAIASPFCIFHIAPL